MKQTVIAIALAALALTACSDRYSIEAGAVTTPMPTAPPQVIVIDRPVPQPTPASHDDGALITIVVLVLAGAMMASGVAIGYIARGKPQQQPTTLDPQSLTLTTNNYYGVQPPDTLPPAQLTEAEQFAILRKMGHSPESARNMIVSGAARQICAPK